MSDPVMDAACRVTLPGGLDPTALPLMVAAAREALAPIRALHRLDKELSCADGCCDTCECGHEWPCDTARLVYESSELEP